MNVLGGCCCCCCVLLLCFGLDLVIGCGIGHDVVVGVVGVVVVVPPLVLVRGLGLVWELQEVQQMGPFHAPFWSSMLVCC